ncbi:MAG TPA: hypothetical protein ENG87_04365 [Candidatus Pacearchaeota archaeon]|nr:hypothetical protein BMS3Abin17_01197 [archaeon BMS3Abin17]HDK42589.1 hypothetical protein [Candidatus Pacearchaeota archaeon]HDZ60415.1 hypothetical protein [Candidatus Pacearchaeota archaeon]
MDIENKIKLKELSGEEKEIVIHGLKLLIAYRLNEASKAKERKEDRIERYILPYFEVINLAKKVPFPTEKLIEESNRKYSEIFPELNL